MLVWVIKWMLVLTEWEWLWGFWRGRETGRKLGLENMNKHILFQCWSGKVRVPGVLQKRCLHVLSKICLFSWGQMPHQEALDWILGQVGRTYGLECNRGTHPWWAALDAMPQLRSDWPGAICSSTSLCRISTDWYSTKIFNFRFSSPQKLCCPSSSNTDTHTHPLRK